MRIGIIGAGNIGQAAAARLVTAGHEVMLSNARGPATITSLDRRRRERARRGRELKRALNQGVDGGSRVRSG